MKFLFNQFKFLVFSISDLIGLVLNLSAPSLDGRLSRGRSFSVWQRIAMVPVNSLYFLGWGFVWLFVQPLRFVRQLLTASPADLLFGLPAMIAIASVGVLVLRTSIDSDTVIQNYRMAGLRAVRAGEPKKAVTIYSRLVNEFESEIPDDKYNWALSMLAGGDVARGTQAMARLAPVDSTGFPKAHRWSAIAIANQLTNDQADPLVLRKLRHHLEKSGDKNSVEISNAWASYYMAVGNEAAAIDHLRIAATTNPAYLIVIAQICERSNNIAGRNRALREAREIFQAAVDRDPLEHSVRVMLARVMYEEQAFDEAENVLLQGVKLQPDDFIRRAVAEYYLLRHDLTPINDQSFAQQFGFLQKSLDQDPNYPPVYERLIAQYRLQDKESESEKVRELLQATVASGTTPALAHFALSNLLWLDGNGTQAEWHIQQAYRLDPKFALIGNNLAWILAHKEVPELDTAYNLSKSVVETVPTEPRFRDTLATVLMKLGRREEAVAEFEKSLVTIREKRPVHEKLAELYALLGNEQLATLHREQATLAE